MRPSRSRADLQLGCLCTSILVHLCPHCQSGADGPLWGQSSSTLSVAARPPGLLSGTQPVPCHLLPQPSLRIQVADFRSRSTAKVPQSLVGSPFSPEHLALGLEQAALTGNADKGRWDSSHWRDELRAGSTISCCRSREHERCCLHSVNGRAA